MIVPMDPMPSPPTATRAVLRRIPAPARAGLLLAAGVLAVTGCGSTPATGAGGGAPGPARTIGDAPPPVTPFPTPSVPVTPVRPQPFTAPRPPSPPPRPRLRRAPVPPRASR